MASDLVVTPQAKHTMQRLEEVKRVSPAGDDYWSAREIGPLLGYAAWDAFTEVITRATNAIIADGADASQHIVQTTKLLRVGQGAKLRGKEFFLSRGACYLIAMNGDPSKPEIAGAQKYFAAQARVAELAASEPRDRRRLRSREEVSSAAKRVNDAAKDAGVQNYQFFNGARYHGLYELTVKEVAKVKGLGTGENLLDRAGPLELAAHGLQMELAATKIVEENISGERKAIDANRQVGRAVRQTILDQSGVKLEDLPLEPEHIRSVRKRIEGRSRLLGQSDKLPK